MKLATAIATVAVAAALLASPAHAEVWSNDRGVHAKCVTANEWRQLNHAETYTNPMSRTEAEHVLDGSGYRARLWHGTVRDYRPCGKTWDRSRVTVHYSARGFFTFASRMDIGEHGSFPLPIGHPRG